MSNLVNIKKIFFLFLVCTGTVNMLLAPARKKPCLRIKRFRRALADCVRLMQKNKIEAEDPVIIPLTDEQIREHELFLCHAAQEGDLKDVQMLVEGGINVDSVNDFNWPVLLIAAYYGQLAVVQYLVAHPIGSANLALTNGIGWTPLHGAAHRGHLEIVKCLVRHGAVVGVKSFSGKSAEDLASMRGFTMVADYLQARRL